MCKFTQIYKNVPGIGFCVKAGRRFAKRMEPHKFVDTNLLINPDPLRWEMCVISEMVTVQKEIYNSHSAKMVTYFLLQIGGKMDV